MQNCNLCKTKLNAKNLFQGINEHGIFILNYYIGLVEFEPIEFEKIDDKIRSILNKNKIHMKAANKKRLYLKINDLERGLENVLSHSDIKRIAQNRG
ncbi:hypothetical protein BDAP_002470 [Binucleata daphniae]